jgi:hypothetical protein
MATSYTSLLGLALPVTGELSGTWGDTVNNAITSLLDTAVAGTTTVSADTTLTTTSGAANQARSAIILASGHVANITITAPAQSKIYTVINASGTYTVTFRGVGPTTGVTLGVNEKAQLAWNGSDFVRIGGSGGAGVFSSITNSSLTSGRVVYSTTGGLETDSANLLFNGTTLTANTLNLTNALTTAYGGTGLTSYTAGDLSYYAAGTVLSKLAIGTAGQILTVNSGATAPQWSTLSGVAVTTFSAGTTGFTPSSATSGAITLAGTLATTNGGTGLTSFTSGGVVYASSSSALTTGSALTFDGSNLGIGTSSPGYKLDVAGSIQLTNSNPLRWKNTSGTSRAVLNLYSDNNVYLDAEDGAQIFRTNGYERMRLDSSGNLGIGTSSPGQKLHVAGNIRTTNSLIEDSGTNVNFGTIAAGYLAFLSGSGAERMRLDSSGNLGLGVTPSSWSTIKPLQLPGGSLAGYAGGAGNNQIGIYNNAYFDGSNYKYVTTDAAQRFVTVAGEYRWYNAPSGTAGNSISFTQAMTLDASGNLIVGGTSTALGLVSVQGTGSYDAISAETSSSTTSSYATSVIRKTSTPASGASTINFIGTREFRAKTQSGTYKTPVQLLAGSITSSIDDNLWGTLQVNVNGYSTTLGNFTQLQLLLGSGSSPRFDVVCADGFGGTYTATQTLDTYFRPGQDNYSTLGQAARRWTTVYATTGTINTSDRNDKQDIEELSAAEQRVAVRVKGLIRKFRFKDSVAAKGDNARIHFGVIAQDVQGAFTAEGLDASRYGLFCSDTFKAIDGKAVEKDENGQYPEGAIDYTRLGVRYEELLAFVISAI